MGILRKRDGWRLPDPLWKILEPLWPPPKPHPLGCHRPRVPNRKAMDAILFVLRTGCQWNALNATGICTSSSAHRRFQEWCKAGVFLQFWKRGLLQYDQFKGIDWSWLSMDGAMSKAPLGGGKNWAQSHRPSQIRRQAQLAHGGRRHSDWTGRGRCQSSRYEVVPSHGGKHSDRSTGTHPGKSARDLSGQRL